MILELDDEDIMDFLMTSEFENEYKTEEFKYLLYKWRYFYRLLHGKNELLKTNATFEINKLKKEIKQFDNKIQVLLMEIANGKNTIDSLKNRKLTFRERFYGKIISK